MPGSDDRPAAEVQPRPPAARRRGKAIATWLSAGDVGGLAALEQWVAQHWELPYDRKELLRLSTIIALGVIDLGLVRRQGRYFALAAVPLADPGAPPPPDGAGPAHAQPVWVGGLTVTGLEWMQRWMRRQGHSASWSDVLVVVLDLALQALRAGLVAPPIGPYVRVRPSGDGAAV